MAYPKYKYHAEKAAVIVNDEEQEAELGEGWADSPADHGIITQPSEEQARQIAADDAAKNKALAETVETAVEVKRGPGRPKAVPAGE